MQLSRKCLVSVLRKAFSYPVRIQILHLGPLSSQIVLISHGEEEQSRFSRLKEFLLPLQVRRLLLVLRATSYVALSSFNFHAQSCAFIYSGFCGIFTQIASNFDYSLLQAFQISSCFSKIHRRILRSCLDSVNSAENNVPEFR